MLFWYTIAHRRQSYKHAGLGLGLASSDTPGFRKYRPPSSLGFRNIPAAVAPAEPVGVVGDVLRDKGRVEKKVVAVTLR